MPFGEHVYASRLLIYTLRDKITGSWDMHANVQLQEISPNGLQSLSHFQGRTIDNESVDLEEILEIQ